MNTEVKNKLMNYCQRLKKTKNNVQRITSIYRDGINVCLIKLPIISKTEWMLVTETNIKCPLCGKSKAVLTGPADYWHPTQIDCYNCGLHVQERNPNRLSIEEVKKQWKDIEDLKLKDIVPFGKSFCKKENFSNNEA